MNVLPVLLGIITSLSLVPVLVLLLQVLMAMACYRSSLLPQNKRPAATILIPAHDEEAVISATLDSILPQLVQDDRVLLVADNCSDETAAIARKRGAEVIERTDLVHRGKGYALDFGIRHLRNDPPEVVIVIDADCVVSSGTIDRLAHACAETSRPVQALYLMRSPEDASLKTRIAEFAWVVKNHVRPLGYHCLGLPCQLMGTGMAFPWPVISNMALASGHIVEDMKLGIDLALAGFPPVFCQDATVISFFPASKAAEYTQRTRWEHGHLGVILREFPGMLAGAFRRRDAGLLGLAVDLMTPPLSLLVLIAIVMLLLNLAVFLAEGIVWPLNLSVITFSLFFVAIVIAWYGWGRRVVSFLSLLMIPYYVISKIPLYLGFLIKRQGKWVKTGRD